MILAGKSFMSYQGAPSIPITFAIFGTSPALAAEFFNINKDLGRSLTLSHETCSSCQEFHEVVMTSIGGIKYRVTLDLAIDKEMSVEFPKLGGLVLSTARELFHATGKKAFELISLSGEVDSVKFEIWWTWHALIES
jgi:hypothetical protein